MVTLEEIDKRYFNSTAEAQNYIRSAMSMGTRSEFRIVDEFGGDAAISQKNSKMKSLAMQIVDKLQVGDNANDLALELCFLILKEGKQK